MVYSLLQDLKTLLEEYNGSYTNSNPDIFIDGEPRQLGGDESTTGTIRILTDRKNSEDRYSQHRYDNFIARVEVTYAKQTTDTKVKTLVKDIQDCLDAENKTGDRQYLWGINSMEYYNIKRGCTVLISAREELIAL